MINSLTLARPYAKAIFSLAVNQGKLEEWKQSLNLLSLILQDQTAGEILNNPNVLLPKKLELIFSIDAEYLISQKNELTNFIKILALKHHLSIMPQIAAFYQKICSDYAHILPAQIISAFDLTQEKLEKMRVTLEKRFQHKINLEYFVNPELIGGAVIYIGDKVIDGSIKGKLKKLREEFKLD